MHRPSPRRWLAAAALIGAASTAHAADLTVSAAASLTQAFREIASMFEARHPGIAVALNVGASDALLAQIVRGAPVDVFASADVDAMDRADASGLVVPGTRRDVAVNALVMIVPSDDRLGLTGVNDLRRPDVRRIAMGRPATVPAGRYAKGALEGVGLWPSVEARIVTAQNVRQALDYVARGEVDAGFVYATDAALMKDRVRVVATLATPTRITYPIAAVAGGPNPAAARRFVDFVADPAARAVLARHGFGAP